MNNVSNVATVYDKKHGTLGCVVIRWHFCRENYTLIFLVLRLCSCDADHR